MNRLQRISAGIFLSAFFLVGAAVGASESPLSGEWSELQKLHQTPEHEKLSRILEASLNRYETVKNYTAIFRKQEVSEGKMGDPEKIFMKFEKPWKIYMGWLDTDKKDLQVVYERGKHKNQLAIHKPGLGLGLVPVVFLDQNSPWVKKGSESYNIEDAGIGPFLHDFSRAILKAAKENQLKILFKKKAGTASEESVEVTFEGSKENTGYFAYRVEVFFDPATRLPVQMELFDWNNQPTGIYTYENLKLDLPAEDAEFKQQINRFLYRVYKG